MTLLAEAYSEARLDLSKLDRDIATARRKLERVARDIERSMQFEVTLDTAAATRDLDRFRTDVAATKRRVEADDIRLDVDIDVDDGAAAAAARRAREAVERAFGSEALTVAARVNADLSDAAGAGRDLRRAVETGFEPGQVNVDVDGDPVDAANLGRRLRIAFERGFGDSAVDPVIVPEVDTTTFDGELGRIEAQLDALTTIPRTIRLDIDAGEILTELAAVDAAIRAITSKAHKVNVEVDSDLAEQTAARTRERLTDALPSGQEVTFTAETSPLDRAIRGLIARTNRVTNEVGQVNFRGNTAGFIREATFLRAELDRLLSEVNTRIELDVDGASELTRYIALLETVDGKLARTQVRLTGSGQVLGELAAIDTAIDRVEDDVRIDVDTVSLTGALRAIVADLGPVRRVLDGIRGDFGQRGGFIDFDATTTSARRFGDTITRVTNRVRDSILRASVSIDSFDFSDATRRSRQFFRTLPILAQAAATRTRGAVSFGGQGGGLVDFGPTERRAREFFRTLPILAATARERTRGAFRLGGQGGAIDFTDVGADARRFFRTLPSLAGVANQRIRTGALRARVEYDNLGVTLRRIAGQFRDQVVEVRTRGVAGTITDLAAVRLASIAASRDIDINVRVNRRGRIGQALGGITRLFGSVARGAARLAGQISRGLSSAFQAVGEVVGGFFDTLAKGFSQVAQQAKQVIGQLQKVAGALTSVASAIAGPALVAGIGTLVGAVVGAVVALTGPVLAALGALVGGAVAFLASSAIGVLAAGGLPLAALFFTEGSTDFLKAQFSTLKDELVVEFAGVVQLIQGSIVPQLVGALRPLISQAAEVADEFIIPITNSLFNLIDKLGPSIQAIAEPAALGISSIVDTLARFVPTFDRITLALGPPLTDALNAVLELVFVLADVFRNDLGGAFQVLADLFREWTQPELLQPFIGTITQIIQFVALLVDAIGKASVEVNAQFGDEFTEALVTLQNLLPQIIDGLVILGGFFATQLPNAIGVFNLALNGSIAIANGFAAAFNLVVGAIFKGIGLVATAALGGVDLVLALIENTIRAASELAGILPDSINPFSGALDSAADMAGWRSNVDKAKDSTLSWGDSLLGSVDDLGLQAATSFTAATATSEFTAATQENLLALEKGRLNAESYVLQLEAANARMAEATITQADYAAAVARTLESETALADVFPRTAEGLAELSENFVNAETSAGKLAETYEESFSGLETTAADFLGEVEGDVNAKSIDVIGAIEIAGEAAKNAAEASFSIEAIRLGGFDPLADFLETLEPDQLASAIDQLGGVGSARMEQANADLQGAIIAGTGGIQGALDERRRTFEQELEKVNLTGFLEASGFENIAAELEALTGPEYDAFLAELETYGPEGMLALEQTFKDLTAENARLTAEVATRWGDEAIAQTTAEKERVERELTTDPAALQQTLVDTILGPLQTVQDAFNGADTDTASQAGDSIGKAVTDSFGVAVESGGFVAPIEAELGEITAAAEATATLSGRKLAIALKAGLNTALSETQLTGILLRGGIVNLAADAGGTFDQAGRNLGIRLGAGVVIGVTSFALIATAIRAMATDALATAGATFDVVGRNLGILLGTGIVLGVTSTGLVQTAVSALATNAAEVASFTYRAAGLALGTEFILGVIAAAEQRVGILLAAIVAAVNVAGIGAGPVLSLWGSIGGVAYMGALAAAITGAAGTAIAAAVGAATAAGLGFVAGFGAAIAALVTVLLTTLTAAYQTAVRPARVFGDQLGDIFVQAYVGVLLSDGVRSAARAAQAIAAALLGTSSLWSRAGQALGRAFSAAAAGGILSGLRAVVGAAAAVGRAAGASIQGALRAGLAGLASIVVGALSGLSGFARGAGSSIGSAIADGIRSGMRAGIAGVRAEAIALAVGIAATIRNILAISSPSRVTMALGEEVSRGFAIGIRNEGAAAAAQAGQTAEAAAAEMRKIAAEGFTLVGSASFEGQEQKDRARFFGQEQIRRLRSAGLSVDFKSDGYWYIDGQRASTSPTNEDKSARIFTTNRALMRRIAEALAGPVGGGQALGEVSKRMEPVGKAANDGFLLGLGLRSGYGGLATAGGAMALVLANSVSNGLQIRSPSQVMYRLGQQAADGLVVGMQSREGDVLGVADGLANALPRQVAAARNGSNAAVSQSTSIDRSSTNTIYVEGSGDPELVARRIERRLDRRRP